MELEQRVGREAGITNISTGRGMEVLGVGEIPWGKSESQSVNRSPGVPTPKGWTEEVTEGKRHTVKR